MAGSIDVIGTAIVDAAYRLHRGLGPGTTRVGLRADPCTGSRETALQGRTTRAVRFEYDGLVSDGDLVVDLLVDDRVVVEVRATERIHPVHKRQTFAYLRVLGLELGYLLNFGSVLMKNGIHRIVNGYRLLRIHPSGYTNSAM